MPSVTLSPKAVTWFDASAPSKTWYRQSSFLALRAAGGAGAAGQAFMYFAAPFSAEGANVAGATLRFRTRALSGTGSRQIAVTRAMTATNVSYANWNTKPAPYGATSTLTKSGALPADELWEIPVTALMQEVANGSPLYGFILTTNSTAESIFIHGAVSAALNPTLEVHWTMAPLPPTGLSPSSGRVVGLSKPMLRANFTDKAGDKTLQAIRVQTSATSAFTSIQWDSGVVDTSQPQLDLNNLPAGAPAFTARTTGQVTWWRTQHQDGSGLWSGWSIPTSWEYRPHPIITIVNPAGATPTISDVTPPFDYTYSSPTGSPQRMWRPGLYRLVGNRWAMLSVPDARTGTQTVWTPPTPIATDGEHKIVYNVWDSYDREATPGDPGYAIAEQIFTFQPSTSVAAVTSLQMQDSGWSDSPVLLSWKRAEQPDQWRIYRDNYLWGAWPGNALFVAGSTDTYQVRDRTVSGGIHNYAVYAVVNGQMSPRASTTGKVVRPGVWLVDGDNPADFVCFIDEDGLSGLQDSMPEVSVTHEPLGAATSVKTTTSRRGYEGTYDGMITRASGMQYPVDPLVWKQRMLEWKSLTGKPLRLMAYDYSIPVKISDVYIGGSEIGGGGEEWRCSFSYRQSGEFMFDERM